ncbi:MAG: quinone-dependent dihydroorotate dehydrogenase [Actinobacteria bacterium]|nr:quinone-dependent dihydroorotate dehydrogenase [Actinomycetota bacterium]
MIYRFVFRLVLRHIPAEVAHSLAAWSVRVITAVPGVRAMLRRVLRPNDPYLRVNALGRMFPNPLGVGGGMDKNVTWFEGLGALGFGFVEVGTVTATPQPGNPPPRVWRLIEDRALVNSMGFPNHGAEVSARRLRTGRSGQTIIGVNIGKSMVVPVERAEEDYRASTKLLAPLADFLVLNVSSPNTPGLRGLQQDVPLRSLIGAVREELRDIGVAVPILIKIGPDLGNGEIDAIADLALAVELDGIIAVNTTEDRSCLKSPSGAGASSGAGGISGAPLKARALEVLERLYARVGDRCVLVSVGGIETADDAWQRIRSGATLVQSHTGFIYGGPLWPWRINRGLAERARASGARSVQAMVGASAPAPRAENGPDGRSNGGISADEHDAEENGRSTQIAVSPGPANLPSASS